MEDKVKGGPNAARTRVRELEKQVEEIRATYGKRVKELEEVGGDGKGGE